jgi:hypothetical protein
MIGLYLFDVYIALGTLLFVGLMFWLLVSLDFSDSIPVSSGFAKKWPPISDDEFIARCHSGVDRDIALRVRAIVSKQLGIPYDQIYPKQNFVNDLGCD